MIKKLRRRLTVILTAITGAVLAAVLLISMCYSIEQTKNSFIQNLSTNTGYMAITLASSDNAESYSWLTEMENRNNYIINVDGGTDNILFEPGFLPVSDRDYIIGVAEVETEYALQLPIETATLATAFSSTAKIVTSDFAISMKAEPLIDSFFTYEMPTQISIEQNTESMSPHISGFPLSESAEATNAITFTVSDASVGDPYVLIDGKYNDEYRVNSVSFYQTSSASDNPLTLTVIEDLSQQNLQIAYVAAGYIILIVLGMVVLGFINWFLSKLVLHPTEESIRKQNEFIAAASHELRSPLTVLKCNLSAVAVSDDLNEQQQYLESAESETDRMGRLIEDLLILAGNDSGKWSLNKEDFDTDALLIETAGKYEILTEKKQQNFVLDLPDEVLGNIHGDKLRISQILSVLLDNAIEYSPPESKITLSAKRKKGKLYISVADNGSGIADEDKKHIFERFYRADKSRTDKTHFGLGLSIARELARLHDGDLTIDDNEEFGTKFILILPK